VLANGAVAAATETGSHASRAMGLLTISVQVCESSPRLAYEVGLDAAAAARRAGIHSLEQISLANAVEAAVDAGQFDDGARLLDDLLSATEDDFIRSGLSFSLAVLAAYHGDADGSTAHLADVQERLQLEDRMIHEQSWHLRASSLVRLLNGDPGDAFAQGMEAVKIEPTGMNAPNALVGCGHAAAWLRDAAKLAETVTAMHALTGPWLERHRRGAEAALAALDGDVGEAAAAFAQVMDEWHRENLPLDHAWCVVDALAVLPLGAVPSEAVNLARATLTELRAQPLLGRLESSMAAAAG